MSIEVYERNPSRGYTVGKDGSKITLKFIVTGTLDEEDAEEALLLVSPYVWDDLWRASYKLEEQGNGLWYAEVDYDDSTGDEQNDPTTDGGDNGGDNDAQPDDKLDGSFDFDTTGATEHIVQSIATQSQTARAPFVAPNTKQAIGVTKDRVEGVEKVGNKLDFSVTTTFSFLTWNFIQVLKSMTGTVNAYPWKTFAPFEVIFLGATGKYKGDNRDNDEFEVTFKFAGNKNETDLAVCPGLTVPFKAGWDYLWCGYSEQVDAAANRTIQLPAFANVEVIYDATDFSQLGLGN